MLITTMNDLPGYEIEEVLGEVFGLTVRSRNVGSQIGASFKSLVGGELKGMTKQLAASRVEAQSRLVEEAEAKGGNAIVAFRFDTSELGSTWTEICALRHRGARPQGLGIEHGQHPLDAEVAAAAARADRVAGRRAAGRDADPDAVAVVRVDRRDDGGDAGELLGVRERVRQQRHLVALRAAAREAGDDHHATRPDALRLHVDRRAGLEAHRRPERAPPWRQLAW
jgi:uncharacterized protein YbjQ (UPF0145 family)